MKSFEQLREDAHRLCIAIENLPAGELQTYISVMASQLLGDIQERERAAVAGGPFIGLSEVSVLYRCKCCGRLFAKDTKVPIKTFPEKFVIREPFQCDLQDCSPA
jgi:hypothetical protein